MPSLTGNFVSWQRHFHSPTSSSLLVPQVTFSYHPPSAGSAGTEITYTFSLSNLWDRIHFSFLILANLFASFDRELQYQDSTLIFSNMYYFAFQLSFQDFIFFFCLTMQFRFVEVYFHKAHIKYTLHFTIVTRVQSITES